MSYDREQIRQFAQAGVIRVEFTKKDGSLRVMRCSLQEKYLRSEAFSSTDTVRISNPATLAVWDVDINEWRSFKIDSVISVVVCD
jgi:WYL_2, Sm-like SH3 beta-barrel fold